MARYTRKDAERCFTRLLTDIGARKATNHSDVGGLRLDYNSIYGGVQIEEISNANGGVTLPFGTGRLKPSEFCSAIRYVEDAVRFRKAKGLSGRRNKRSRRR